MDTVRHSDRGDAPSANDGDAPSANDGDAPSANDGVLCLYKAAKDIRNSENHTIAYLFWGFKCVKLLNTIFYKNLKI